jgi:hypothetical protein
MRIDHFVRAQPKDKFFLTHAHRDHMNGLVASFRQRPNQIYCTKITADLAKMQVEGLSGANFHVIPLNRAVDVGNGVTVWAIESHHCDGSCMFLFEVAPTNKRILFTGDFRFHDSLRRNPILTEHIVDCLHFDDTFAEIDVGRTYPTYRDTYHVLLRTVRKIRKKCGPEYPITINASILGVEPLLRKLSNDLEVSFSLSQGLSSTFRKSQLEYLLPGQVSAAGSIVLGHRDRDDVGQGIWLFLTSTHFMCPEPKAVPVNHTYIWFTTHPNRYEINRLMGLVGVVEESSVACTFSVAPLKCPKDASEKNTS